MPFRLGDVLRSIVLGQKTELSKVFTFATTITERVLDTLFLVLLGLILGVTLNELPVWLRPAMRVLCLLSFSALLLLLIAPRTESIIKRIIRFLPIRNKLQENLIQFEDQFLIGARTFQNLKSTAIFFIFTCLIWLLDCIAMLITSKAFNIDLSIEQSLFLLVCLGLSSIIPSAPGNIGVYQFVATLVLSVFSISKDTALAYIIVVQGISMLLTLLWGLAGIINLHLGCDQQHNDGALLKDYFRIVKDEKTD